MQASAPVWAATRHVSDKRTWHIQQPLIFINTIKDCTILSTRLNQSGITTSHGQCKIRQELPGVLRTLSRLIAILASLEGPLTRRLICPHRLSISGLVVPYVEARHWPESPKMLPYSPADYASFFGLPAISLPSSHHRLGADPGKCSASQAQHGLVCSFRGWKQSANKHVTELLGTAWFLSTPRYPEWSCIAA
jgi:hypothetical protein